MYNKYVYTETYKQINIAIIIIMYQWQCNSITDNINVDFCV